MPSRQEIFDAVNSGFERMEKQIDALQSTVKAADSPQKDGADLADGTSFTLEEYRANEFQARKVPFTGSRRINKSFRKDPGHWTCFQFKLTAVEGDITIKSAEASSENPSLDPGFDPIEMKAGRVIPEGKWMIFRCRTKLPGKRTDINFKIAVDDGTEEGEKIIDITADLSTQIQPEPN